MFYGDVINLKIQILVVTKALHQCGELLVFFTLSGLKQHRLFLIYINENDIFLNLHSQFTLYLFLTLEIFSYFGF